MSNQPIPNTKKSNQISFPPHNRDHSKASFVLDSSFSPVDSQKSQQKQISQQVLKKVSQTIVHVHSTLMPKTCNLQIYRDLSKQQQQTLQKIKNDQLIHTIYAGVLAIESCLKEIYKQESYVINTLMKGVTVMLGNFKKMEEQIRTLNDKKVGESMLKVYDSLKLVVNDIHKLPGAKLKGNQRQKHNELMRSSTLNQQLTNIVNREENLLFSLLMQENNSQRVRMNELENKLKEAQGQKLSLLKKHQTSPVSSKTGHQLSQVNFNQTASDSHSTHSSLLIKQLTQQVSQKNEIIKSMNYQFTVEIQKYDKIFKKLQDENKTLRKYHDLDVIALVEQLQYEVEMLKEDKKLTQLKFNKIITQITQMAWYQNQPSYESSKINTRPRIDTRLNPNNPIFYETKRSRCPSVSPTNKPQNPIHRYFSPNFQQPNKRQPEPKDINKNTLYKNINLYSNRPESKFKRDNSPSFGSPIMNDNRYETQNQRTSPRLSYLRGDDHRQLLQRAQMLINGPQTQKSRNKLGSHRIQKIQSQKLQLKNDMKRSKFLNPDIGYM